LEEKFTEKLKEHVTQVVEEALQKVNEKAMSYAEKTRTSIKEDLKTEIAADVKENIKEIKSRNKENRRNNLIIFRAPESTKATIEDKIKDDKEYVLELLNDVLQV